MVETCRLVGTSVTAVWSWSSARDQSSRSRGLLAMDSSSWTRTARDASRSGVVPSPTATANRADRRRTSPRLGNPAGPRTAPRSPFGPCGKPSVSGASLRRQRTRRPPLVRARHFPPDLLSIRTITDNYGRARTARFRPRGSARGPDEGSTIRVVPVSTRVKTVLTQAGSQSVDTTVGPLAFDGRTITLVARTRAMHVGDDGRGALHVRSRPSTRRGSRRRWSTYRSRGVRRRAHARRRDHDRRARRPRWPYGRSARKQE